jgi:hypothetical protein
VEAALRVRTYEDDGWSPFVASQWRDLHTTPAQIGPRALLTALLEEAWRSAVSAIPPLPPGRHSKYIRQQYRRTLSTRREALEWFGRDSIAPFSFLFACAHLQLDAGRLRRALSVALARRDRAPVVLSSGSSLDVCRDQWESQPLARHGT